MFERFNEHVRRSLFFARYEASRTSSRTISLQHVLLGMLREGEPPVVGYLKGGRLILDLRTVDPLDDSELIAAVSRALEETSPA